MHVARRVDHERLAAHPPATWSSAALDHDLIAGVAGHAADHQREHDRDDVERLLEERPHAAPAARRSIRQSARCSDVLPAAPRRAPDLARGRPARAPAAIQTVAARPPNMHAELDHVVPDHRLDAAERRVERDDARRARTGHRSAESRPPVAALIARHGTYIAVAIQPRRQTMKMPAASVRTRTSNRASRYS